MTSPAVPLADRLWSRVQKTEGCWLWTGPTAPTGFYGHLVYQGKHWGAHRLSWTLANGEVPAGMHVLHRCDEPRCVRPDHLFVGTHRENMRDAANKGRMHRGEANGIAKLTWGKVRAIRQSLADERTRGIYARLAVEHGVSEGTIRLIDKGEVWHEDPTFGNQVAPI